jgi:hypothetical protein
MRAGAGYISSYAGPRPGLGALLLTLGVMIILFIIGFHFGLIKLNKE